MKTLGQIMKFYRERGRVGLDVMAMKIECHPDFLREIEENDRIIGDAKNDCTVDNIAEAYERHLGLYGRDIREHFLEQQSDPDIEQAEPETPVETLKRYFDIFFRDNIKSFLISPEGGVKVEYHQKASGPTGLEAIS